MNEELNIVVLTHNPEGKWGDVRPSIEENGYYKNWNKSLNVEVGQTVLIYITGHVRQIQYIMTVTEVTDQTIDLKLTKKLTEEQSTLLSFDRLKKHGLKAGTINYFLNNNQELYSYVKKIIDNKLVTKESKILYMKTKNIILYGAPGVGKTHNYQNLISMIEEGKSQKEIFDIISKNEKIEQNSETFKTIKEEKRVEFVTFHQSYSYEDFIEGFRPNDKGDIELEKYGIFKKICKDAEDNLKNSKIDIKEDTINLDELIVKFTNYVQDTLDNDKEFSLDKKVTIEGINDKGAFSLGGSIKSPQRLTPDIIKRDYEEFKKGIISKYEDIKPTRESKSLYHGNARYYYMIYKKLFDFEKKLNYFEIKQEREEERNFYIVIDEINRGNISKIFGELITLIEEDKRDNYEVTLPYSKDIFKVPSNLYIIATMNSTDKSIATIDIALRRRFTFLKMEPNPNLVENTEAKELMKKLNEFIEKTLGEDNKLGHSYFMKVKNKEDLDFVKEYKIKPLLQEYFYADDRLKEVLDILDKEDS